MIKLVFSIILVILIISLSVFLIFGHGKTAKNIIPPIPVFNQSPSPAGHSVSLPAARASVAPLTVLPAAPSAQQIEGNSVYFPILAGNYIYYLSDDGTTFYKISLDGKDKQHVSDFLPTDIKAVSWAPNQKAVIIKVVNNLFSGSQTGPFYSSNDPDLTLTNWYYNFDSKQAQQLDTAISSPVFLPNQDNIVYLKKGNTVSKYLPTKNTLYVSTAEGAGENLLATIPETNQNEIMYMRDNLILSFATPPEGTGKLYATNIDSKSVSVLYDKKQLAGINPSPNGKKIILQIYNQGETNPLSLLDTASKSDQDLGLSADARLTAWSSDGNSIYVLAPPTLWVIDSQTLSKSKVDITGLVDGLKVDIDNGILAGPDNHTIFYTQDHKLYKLSF